MKRVALIGCGVIGTFLAKAIDNEEINGTKLCFVYDSKVNKAKNLLIKLNSKPQIAKSIDEIYKDRQVNLVIEAASQLAVKQYSIDILKSRKDLIVMSVGAFSDNDLLNRVKKVIEKTGSKLYIPSGAILGIDGIKAAAKAGIEEVTLTTCKPPDTLAQTSYVCENKIDLSNLNKPLVVFEGSARDAVNKFPKSVNVASTLSLSGFGFDKTKVKIIADPSLDRNVHKIQVRGKAGEFFTKAFNVPSPDNPKTSYLAALSIIRTLSNLTDSIVIGT